MDEPTVAQVLHALAEMAPGDDNKRAELHRLIDEAMSDTPISGEGGEGTSPASAENADGPGSDASPSPEEPVGVVTPEGVHVVPAIPGVDPADMVQPPPVSDPTVIDEEPEPIP